MLASCLNILVTTDFLKLRQVYISVLNGWLIPHFAETLSTCKLALTNLSPRIMQDIAASVKIQ
jgi:hypothetical protein